MCRHSCNIETAFKAVQSSEATLKSTIHSYKKYLCLICLGLSLPFGALFAKYTLCLNDSDFVGHLKFIKDGIETGNWPPHPLFHWLVYSLAGFQNYSLVVAVAAIFVAVGCILAKAWISLRLLWQYQTLYATHQPLQSSRISSNAVLALSTLGLMFASPIWDPLYPHNIYLGKISPNVWHNPTSLMVWPFAILLFIAAVDFFEKGMMRSLVGVCVFAVLNVMAKPNYFLAFVPVFVVTSFVKFRLSRRWFAACLALMPCVAILFLQYHYTYGENSALQHRKVVFAPFALWSIYSSCIPLSVILSIAFPATYLCLYGRRLCRPRPLILAWVIFGVALLWMIAFAERNPDDSINTHGNFVWGAVISLYVVFLLTMCDFLCQVTNRNLFLRQIVWGVFFAHVACGVFWYVRQLFGYGYY